ncbi:glutamine--tRNA ligase/YqeY domain fusion protein [Delftia tsuruhatensis]|uniref:glutamine--tRNA ligase/YqeY domain fusion protein n=1 Tax=Delftia tsuruhatensis TaxID=180282 RepID=UPI002260C042|nr:glutamine--tRNA ligase/YqeY domain fusion protein [Delftia tsuruhatensis]MCX7509172.1 glutamine--tRNA ligase/YqeY domain fusion protein [Delftia tsuruhatensis]MDH0777317.1 glutamine--tRNA ligase/YqeY domain fusion protein [Delftia tsuruhatensis]MDH1461508.1 glutamine--tRNA ligase/YqeY domain fusion protein [Delftia tsuruhatensis]MDH1825906.1 glutamine--tRNA ligase/YqeY domain fusion protein [Delftia tsuruhatensis]WGG09129.1 glutamine--tRNA ligase/YqeY domain fusion protein [Delftia tsuruhat
MSSADASPISKDPVKPSNFLRQIIEADLANGTYAQRRWGGSPGDGDHHNQGQVDVAKIRTRFPPEPNGYLHVGHAKAICLNFGLARDYQGACHLRFDDTNPEKEDQEYVDSIIDAVHWLGFGWKEADGHENLYFASNYFDFMYRAAEYLIEQGLAYVDEQSADDMKANRGDFSRPGVDSPFRNRTVAENLARFREMRDGKLPDGAAVLRAKIDMASPNINLRDPAIYRVRHAEHHNTGNQWCIYPMYTFAHPIEDALEHITHSICTLEFEDQRPFYDWLLDHLRAGGLIAAPQPRQYEFSRLHLTYVITSKRKLKHLVDNGIVSGWDDPRMPTIVGLRRRGYTPQSIQAFCERIGVTKDYAWIDYSTLEGCLREDLENQAHRGMVALDPLKLELTNWAEVFGSADHLEACELPALPHAAEGQQVPVRRFTLGREVWIEREDFAEVPPKGYKRLFPGNKVRLKGGYVIECTGCEKDAEGNVTKVLATVVPDTKSGTPGADSVKVKAAITWVGAADGVQAEVRLYDRLFTDPQPDAGGKDFLALLNPDSLKVVTAYVEPSLAQAQPDDKFQFERFGYFVADRKDHAPGKPVFNRATGLKDSWGK